MAIVFVASGVTRQAIVTRRPDGTYFVLVSPISLKGPSRGYPYATEIEAVIHAMTITMGEA